MGLKRGSTTRTPVFIASCSAHNLNKVEIIVLHVLNIIQTPTNKNTCL